MYWKSVKYLLRKISIRTRLTFFYSLSGFLLLSLIAMFLYWVTINILYKADYQFLSDEVDTVQYILHNKAYSLDALKQACVETPSERNHSIYRYYIRVFDDKGGLIIQTPGMENILPAQFAFKPSDLLIKKRYLWYSSDDRDYMLIQSPIQLGIKNKFGLIQIALDISYQHKVVSDRKKLVFALLTGTILALLLGYLIANRGLRSLYVLTETVKMITATSLHQRIDPKSWPTELGALGVAFNQMLERIESSFVRLKQLSSDLAHELRIPIHNFIGETELALSRTHTNEEYQQVLNSNLEELQRISQLIESMLFLSRAENPQIDIQKAPIRVHDEISFVFDYYQTMAEEKNIQMTLEGKGELNANSIMFRRMISNILSNSLNYTPENGMIHFSVVESDKDTLHIIASDNGIGISEEHLPKIFDRFYRVDSARTQHSGGTGLGLAIVKSIVELHDGTISITSQPDKGTAIFMSFRKSGSLVAASFA